MVPTGVSKSLFLLSAIRLIGGWAPPLRQQSSWPCSQVLLPGHFLADSAALGSGRGADRALAKCASTAAVAGRPGGKLALSDPLERGAEAEGVAQDLTGSSGQVGTQIPVCLTPRPMPFPAVSMGMQGSYPVPLCSISDVCGGYMGRGGKGDRLSSPSVPLLQRGESLAPPCSETD